MKSSNFFATRAKPLGPKSGVHFSRLSSADQVQQIAMDRLVAGADRPLGQHLGAAVRVGDEASRLLHDDNTSRDIPGMQITRPKAVVASRGYKAKIDGGGAEAAKIRRLRHDRGEIG